MYLINRVFNPDIFQGKYKKDKYFEGWYYKLVDKDSKNVLAFIPGIAITKTKSQSFIQFIDAKTGFSEFISYPYDAFKFSERTLDIHIENSQFDKFGVSLNIKTDKLNVYGNINFKNIISFPTSTLSPGIMGPFAFVPFMECHHGIVNIHSHIIGSLNYNGNNIDFTDGYGYLEKDWGRSFPKSWIWFQSNHFKTNNTCIMFSIAAIPWLYKEFNGLIAFFVHEGKFYRFATYTGAKIQKLKADETKVEVIITDKKYIIQLDVKNSISGILKAPNRGLMDVNIKESITAEVKVMLCEKNGKIIYEGVGTNTGLELTGNYKQFENHPSQVF